MARGWESKSVESQMDSAAERKAAVHRAPLTTEQLEAARVRELLELSRTRTVQDLAAATNPRYRALLEATLQHLESRLAELTKPTLP